MTSLAVRGAPTSRVRRTRISAAALFVNVTAHIEDGASECVMIRLATRHVNTRVLPLPGPARICSAPDGSNVTATM